MKKQSVTFASSNGKDPICGYWYEPEGPVRAVLQISHGMCEYIERYEPFIEYMTERGVAVCGNDHLGHGKGARALGQFAEKNGRAYLVRDLYSMTERAKERWAGAPYFLLGHSMGSFVARQYTVKYGWALDGVIYMGTSGKNPLNWAGIALTNMLGVCKGKKARSRLIDKLAFGSYNKRIEKPMGEDDWLSRDVEVVRAYGKDPLCKFTFTIGAYHELFKLLRGVSGKGWAQQVPQRLPILLISGEADPVGQYGKGVRQAAEWLRQTGHEDVSLVLYPGARHEVLNETNRAEAYQDVAAWMEDRMQ